MHMTARLLAKEFRIVLPPLSKPSFTAFDTLPFESITSMGIDVLRSETMPILLIPPPIKKTAGKTLIQLEGPVINSTNIYV